MTAAVLLLAIALTVAIVVFARRRPDYRHVRNTISELGERGGRDEALVSFGVFLPVGVGLAVIAFVHHGASATLAGVIAVGYVGAAVFPCDPGSPLHGSTRQTLHNLAGGVEYIGGALALWSLGGSFRALAVVVAATAVALSLPVVARWRGLVQRIGEVALFGGLAVAL